MYMCLCVDVYVHDCLQEGEWGVEFPRTGVTIHCEHPMWAWERNLDPQPKYQVLLTSEPSLQPYLLIFQMHTEIFDLSLCASVPLSVCAFLSMCLNICCEGTLHMCDQVSSPYILRQGLSLIDTGSLT